jgi:hypothetical protein
VMDPGMVSVNVKVCDVCSGPMVLGPKLSVTTGAGVGWSVLLLVWLQAARNTANDEARMTPGMNRGFMGPF